MTVEHGDGTKLLHIRQSLLAVIGSPSPIGIDGPKRNVCKKNNGSTGGAPVEIVLKPLELLVTERSHSSRLQIGDIHQADEMHSLVIEAVPSGAFCPLAVTLEKLLAVIGQHVMLARNKVDLLRRCAF